MGNPFGSLWNDVKQGTGTALNQGADLLGDGLNAVGLTGAAVAVDTLGDKAGYSLGADVPELQLGQTSDPAELVHGDPAAIRSSAAQLRTFSSAFGETSAGLKGLDTAHWTGSAADAFRAKFTPHPAKWQDASSATGTTSAALESYAGAVESAQGQATRAIGLYAQGQQATAAAQAAYNQQVAAYNSAAQAYNAQLAAGQNPGTPPAEPGPFSDPGEAMRQDAQQILLEARSARDSEAAAASAAIRPATGLAPAEPSFWSQLGSDFSDAMQVGNLASISLVGGAVDGVADIAKFARSIDPADSWNMEHPAEYVAGLSGTAAGLANDVINPQDLVKSLVGSGWGSDPAQALGRLVPNIALAVGTDGAGAAADAGTSIAERAALGTGEDAAAAGLDGVASDPAAAARPPADIPTAGDPVDVATGDVVLAQTDVTLPGLLPLVVERMHRSSWRAGRWFGRSWASTFDQRLQVRADRVIGAFADGRVLIWPQSREGRAGAAGRAGVADGAVATPAVLPVTGAPWPLRREPDGAWTVTDPQRGLVWRFARRQGYFFSGDQGELPLVALSDRAGHEIRFGYDEAGTPAWVWHSGGYLVRVNVTDGRVTSLALGGPRQGRRARRQGRRARRQGRRGRRGRAADQLRLRRGREPGQCRQLFRRAAAVQLRRGGPADRVAGPQRSLLPVRVRRSGALRARRGLRSGPVGHVPLPPRCPRHHLDRCLRGRHHLPAQQLRPGRRDHRPPRPFDRLGARRARAGHRLHRPAGPGHPVPVRHAGQRDHRHPSRRQPGARHVRRAQPARARGRSRRAHLAAGVRRARQPYPGHRARWGRHPVQLRRPRSSGQRHRSGRRRDPGRVRPGWPAGGGDRPGWGACPL